MIYSDQIYAKFTFRSVDCSIKCYSDAVSPCLSQGVYQTVDLEVVKVVRRFACENPTGRKFFSYLSHDAVSGSVMY